MPSIADVATTIITDGLTQTIPDVVESQRSKGIRASGMSADSLNVASEERGTVTSTQLRGSRTFTWQQNGRGPNKSGKPGKAQLDGLREWIAIRGIDAGALWPIAISQAREGTKVPNPYNPGGVLSDVLNVANIKAKIGDRLREGLKTELKSRLFNLK